MQAQRHAKYILTFIENYRKNTNIFVREIESQRLKAEYAFEDMHDDDMYAGRYLNFAVGCSPQESNQLGYFLNNEVYKSVYDAVDSATQEKLSEAIGYFQNELTNVNIRKAYPKEISDILTSDNFIGEAGIGFPLYRLGGTHPDYKKLIDLGIDGLRNEILKYYEKNSENELYPALLQCLDIFSKLCGNYAERAEMSGRGDVAVCLKNIMHNPPSTMREALQLVNLYSLLCGSFNYGRLDNYLSRFADDEDALDCLVGFWKMINLRKCIWDGRVIIGGVGRGNEAMADKVALLAIEASRICKDVLPQLTLRFYDGQNPELLKKSYDNFSEGVVYPMLYRDEINISAVSDAFGLDTKTAENYLPFGCGEYVIDHCSVGTPSGVINLLAALNDTLKNDYTSFDKLFDAYKATVEKYIDALAIQEKFEYDFLAKVSPQLYLSMLFDDCIARGKALLDGGVRYVGGTLESYGNTNTADSLVAIKKMVFDEKIITQSQLRNMLEANFAGYEREQKMLLDCPKYGNDNDEADNMAQKVHNHVCKYTKSLAHTAGLDSYLIVIINNNANTTMGMNTAASADGRNAFEPMANANNPTGGRDKSGVTAFLNSLTKLDNHLHAGATQNMKFNRKLIREHRDMFEILLNTYFEKGQQAMLNILSKGELEDALIHPDKYQNLIVRVGGFSAKFIELDRKTQEEILSRTLY